MTIGGRVAIVMARLSWPTSGLATRIVKVLVAGDKHTGADEYILCTRPAYEVCVVCAGVFIARYTDFDYPRDETARRPAQPGHNNRYVPAYSHINLYVYEQTHSRQFCKLFIS